MDGTPTGSRISANALEIISGELANKVSCMLEKK
jgi:hypothetical protein